MKILNMKIWNEDLSDLIFWLTSCTRISCMPVLIWGLEIRLQKIVSWHHYVSLQYSPDNLHSKHCLLRFLWKIVRGLGKKWHISVTDQGSILILGKGWKCVMDKYEDKVLESRFGSGKSHQSKNRLFRSTHNRDLLVSKIWFVSDRGSFLPQCSSRNITQLILRIFSWPKIKTWLSHALGAGVRFIAFFIIVFLGTLTELFVCNWCGCSNERNL